MKKMIFIFFFFPLIVYSQENRQFNIGSAKILTGNVYAVSIFVSDRNNQWEYEEKLQMIKLRNDAQVWLQDQASRYGVTVNFENGNFGLDNDIKLSSIPSMLQEDANYMVTTTLNAVGWNSSLQFYEAQKKRMGFENMFVLIFVKGMGQGYGIPYLETLRSGELFYLEGAVIFQKFDQGEIVGMTIPAGSIAHEILHLFGAWDLYMTHTQTSEVEEKAKIIFFDSIMHRMSFNLNDLIVDELTAWLIGWHNNPEYWFESFNPRP